MSAGIGHPAATVYAASAGIIDVAEDIRDIRGPKPIAGTSMIPALVTGGLLLGAAIYAIWRRRHRAGRRRAPLPFELALERLEGIRPLITPARAREFGIAASEIVRSYIEQRFDVVASQRTTEEFLQDLLHHAHASLEQHRPLLAQFLQQCDFVKFAGDSLTQQNLETLFHSARSFVLETGQPPAA